MKQVGSVEVPQEAFLAVLNLGRRQEVSRRRATSTSTCRSARTAAATATSSPRSGGAIEHGAYVDALLAELELERDRLADRVETVFLGGGTPTFTEPGALARLLAALPDAGEVTVEANPETVTPELAALLRDGGVNRVSLGAQSFAPAPARRRSSAAPRPTTSAAPCTLFAMPDLTTSRSISSTASPARAPPTSSAISPRRSPSSRSTCPATSSRRSRARGSRTRTEQSSSARRRRSRATSSASSRR